MVPIVDYSALFALISLAPFFMVGGGGREKLIPRFYFLLMSFALSVYTLFATCNTSFNLFMVLFFRLFMRRPWLRQLWPSRFL